MRIETLPSTPRLHWIRFEDQNPEREQWIIYSTSNELLSGIGRYGGKTDPMPSLPSYIDWNTVKYWMPFPELPKEGE